MKDKVFSLIEDEKKRLNTSLELIPSENFVSVEVLEALGSTFTNKYSEGYPGKRYYGGNIVIDQLESLTQQRAKALFGCEHVNVQPYSGSPANLAAMSAVVPVGGKIMGLNLSQGGHLTHGHKVSFTGKVFASVQYGVDEKTHLLDYDAILKLAKQEQPKLLISGATAYPRTIDFKQFQEIAEEVGAVHMADIAHIAGLIVGKAHPSPFPFTDIVTTTTHKTLRGPRAGMIMCKEKFAKKIDRQIFPGLQGGPHNNVIAAIAVALKEASTPNFIQYASQIVKNAKALGDELMARGVPLVTGGTDNHLLLIDLTTLKMGGVEAEHLLDEMGITANKNTIPYDVRSPFDPSGIRMGTPAVTTRGMKEGEMKHLGAMIAQVLYHPQDVVVHQKVKQEVLALCKAFPLY